MLGPLGVLWNLGDSGWGRSGNKNNGSDPQPPEQNPTPQKPTPQRQDGPPDLDELWRDFNQKLNNLFGGKRGGNGNRGGGGNGSGSNMKGAGIGVGLILGLVALLWLGSGFYIVPEGKTSIILQFGKYKAMTTNAGFLWRLPYPIESHEIVDLQTLRQIRVGGGVSVNKDTKMLTEDQNIVDVQFAVQYRISDAMAYLFNNRMSASMNEESPDTIIMQIAETAMREVIGKNKIDQVLYQGKPEIAKNARSIMQAMLDRYQAGVQVVDVTIQNTRLPEQVQAAFDDALKAGQDRERLKNEGQAYANAVIPGARGPAARLLEEAQGYSQRVVATAEGDAARFKAIVAEYNKAPVVTRQRMYLDTMQRVFENTTKVMVDARGGSNLLYLPLDKLIQQISQDATPRAPTTASSEPAAPAAGLQDNRTRDALRNREGR